MRRVESMGGGGKGKDTDVPFRSLEHPSRAVRFPAGARTVRRGRERPAEGPAAPLCNVLRVRRFYSVTNARALE
jgi:hypothetical protein